MAARRDRGMRVFQDENRIAHDLALRRDKESLKGFNASNVNAKSAIDRIPLATRTNALVGPALQQENDYKLVSKTQSLGLKSSADIYLENKFTNQNTDIIQEAEKSENAGYELNFSTSRFSRSVSKSSPRQPFEIRAPFQTRSHALSTELECLGRPKWSASEQALLNQATQLWMKSEADGEINDEDEQNDISMVWEYSDEIFSYMRELETNLAPNPHLFDHQQEIEAPMRRILIDWLVQVHGRFHLLAETLFLAVNIIDRFLSIHNTIALDRFQLLGATALLIAAKYEEIHCPAVSEMEYMCDNAYSQEEILACERQILLHLEFSFSWPGPMSFLRRISKADDYDIDIRTLAKYILEITIMDEKFIGGHPSFLAAASHYVARKMLRRNEWTWAHTYLSGYTSTVLQPAVTALLESLRVAPTDYRAIYEKYADRKFKHASKYAERYLRLNREN